MSMDASNEASVHPPENEDHSEDYEDFPDHYSEVELVDMYPPEFPLSPAVYEQDETAEDEAYDQVPVNFTAREATENDHKLRRIVSLFPYHFLDPDGIWQQPASDQYMEMPLGYLRNETIKTIAASGSGGQMQYIEFVPAWTDPEWTRRFVFTGAPGTDPVNDPQYVMYAKKGIMQTQRPALRGEDAVRNPTAVAKRYGVDPARADDLFYGNSGVTPTRDSFSVRLGNPRVTPSNQGVRDVVDKDDYDVLFARYRNTVAAAGGYAVEDDFRKVLTKVAGGGYMSPALGAACDVQIASAVLRYLEGKDRLALQEEYQRVIFAGSTTNELVETGVWTMDKTADADLVTPLHDLLTREKWEVTTNRGTVPDAATGGIPLDSRKVYSFPTQKGEYCAANDYLWLALQPALQLATMVLNSDHPATWSWADIYKMSPCQDSRQAGPEVQDVRDVHRAAGVTRKEYFAVHPEEDPDEFYPEVERLKEMGFESTRWVCEILRKCIVWELNSKYTEVWGQSTPWVGHMAWTRIEPDNSTPDRPFIIRISLSVDYIWPLLVDEYSQAEKAACSFILASTMVHELCHAIVYARCQLFHVDRVWLRFNSNWEAQVGEEALRLLQVFGYRQVWDDTQVLEHRSILMSQDAGHDFYEGDVEAEEGWATENQYWGGAPDTLGKGGYLPKTRFLDELSTMVSFNSWPRGEQAVLKAIPFSLYSKFFYQVFWEQEVQKWGPEALKIWPLTTPRAYSNWSVFAWSQIQLRFGYPAMAWMCDVSERVKYDDEHAVLWAWLHALARLAVEPKMCMIRWNQQQEEWKPTDKLLWTKRNTCKAKADQLVAYLQQIFDEIHSGQPVPDPVAPIEYGYFREAFAALSSMHRTLSHEASVYQLITLDFHRQTGVKTKTDIRYFYAEKLRTRLDSIHSRIAADCIGFLDAFENIDATVLLRISQNQQAVELLDTGRRALREKFVAVQHAIRPVRLSFDEDPLVYKFDIRDFANVKPITAQPIPKRMERTAKEQLLKLTGPLLKLAQGWIMILERGERLRNAAEGTADATLNAKLTQAVNFIDEVKQRQQQAVAQQYPSPGLNMTRMLSNPGLLQPPQRGPDASMRMQRFNTASAPGQINPWQTVYAEASGFVPYQDHRTGLTRFYRANIPTEAGPSVNPRAAAQAQAQGQGLVGALAPGFAPGGITQAPGGQFQAPGGDEAAFRSLMQGLSQTAQGPGGAAQYFQPGSAGQPVAQSQAHNAMRALIDERGRQVQANPAIAGHVVPSIYNRALQTVAGPNGASLINNNMPGANNLFGLSAAQNSMANQQLENLVRQQALGPEPYATLGNMTGGGVAPAIRLYDPVGANASQGFPQEQPRNQQQFIPRPQQAQFPPHGGQQGPGVFPPQQAQFLPQGGQQGPGVFPPQQAQFLPQGGQHGPGVFPPQQAQFLPQGGQQGPGVFPPPQAPQFPPRGGFHGQ